MAASICDRVSALDRDGDSDPAADAETGETLLRVAADHLMQQRHHIARSVATARVNSEILLRPRK